MNYKRGSNKATYYRKVPVVLENQHSKPPEGIGTSTAHHRDPTHHQLVTAALVLLEDDAPPPRGPRTGAPSVLALAYGRNDT